MHTYIHMIYTHHDVYCLHVSTCAHVPYDVPLSLLASTSSEQTSMSLRPVLKKHILIVIPDPGALNSRMRTFPGKIMDLLWFDAYSYAFAHGIRDPRFEILRILIN